MDPKGGDIGNVVGHHLPMMLSPQTQQLVRPTANAEQRLRFGKEQYWEHSITVLEYVT